MTQDDYLRLGRGTVLKRDGAVYRWRTPGTGAGDANTAALHSLTDEL